MIPRWIKSFSLIALATLLIACLPNARKVRIDYRRAPVIENIMDMSIGFWKVIQKNTEFDTSRDLESVFLKEVKNINSLKNFRTVEKSSLSFELKDDTSPTLKDQITAYDWPAWNAQNQIDLVILGDIFYEASDYSGYDSEWKVNRYGYRVPSKVWKDRTSYKFRMNLYLVDTLNNRIVVDKTYEADETTEGAADEVGVFFEVSQTKIRAFLDFIIGKKVNATRYLMRE